MAKFKINNKDFFWKHADILYTSTGVNPSGYDERVIPFTALKVLIDYRKVKFNLDYRNKFGLSDRDFEKIKGNNLRETFLNLIKNIEEFSNFKYMEQKAIYNDPNNDSEEKESAIKYFNEAFNFENHIKEISEDYLLEAILDIYNSIDFKEVPKEQFKDLYESTISRMRKGKQRGFNGNFIGQHFTQSATVKLICEVAYSKIKDQNKLAIYDPTCGVGMMLIESYFFFKSKGINEIKVYGQEIDLRVWLLAKIFMEALDIPNILAKGNTLTNPLLMNELENDESFKIIIANPPYGIDWKHEEKKVIENLKNEKESPFYIIKDHNNNLTLPPKNDGQFLFMLHIIKLMLNEKKKGRNTFAGIISSPSLSYSSGKSEEMIRQRIFETGIVDTMLLQPQNMFTNTSIQTYIWFLNTQKIDNESKYKITLIRADNEELHSKHPEPVDNMKNTYSDENIKEIVNLINSSQETVEGKKKIINVKDGSSTITKINISSEIQVKQHNSCENIDLYELYMDLNKKLELLTQLTKTKETEENSKTEINKNEKLKQKTKKQSSKEKINQGQMLLFTLFK